MGLDMFLIKKKKAKGNKKIYDSLDWNNENEIAYWRKANQIHKWIVDNIQEGIDNCNYYYITKDKIQELVDICNDIIAKVKLIDGQVLLSESWSNDNNGEKIHTIKYGIGKVIDKPEICEELLPTQEGFFFGGTEYDEWYYEQIKYTRDRLTAIIDLLDDDKWDIYYGSSW